MWSTHMMDRDLVTKRKEALIPATKWVNPENIMLSERSQTDTERQVSCDSSYMNL